MGDRPTPDFLTEAEAKLVQGLVGAEGGMCLPTPSLCVRISSTPVGVERPTHAKFTEPQTRAHDASTPTGHQLCPSPKVSGRSCSDPCTCTSAPALTWVPTAGHRGDRGAHGILAGPPPRTSTRPVGLQRCHMPSH